MLSCFIGLKMNITVMKAIILYITIILTAILVSIENISLVWLLSAVLDIALVLWCRRNISIRELSRFTGNNAWYKAIGRT